MYPQNTNYGANKLTATLSGLCLQNGFFFPSLPNNYIISSAFQKWDKTDSKKIRCGYLNYIELFQAGFSGCYRIKASRLQIVPITDLSVSLRFIKTILIWEVNRCKFLIFQLRLSLGDSRSGLPTSLDSNSFLQIYHYLRSRKHIYFETYTHTHTLRERNSYGLNWKVVTLQSKRPSIIPQRDSQ
jgi:hypothetical protein